MTHEYELELEAPSLSRCDCCGGLTVSLTRFVHRDGAAYAIYYARYAHNHPDGELALMISVGEWGDHAHQSRVAFYCRVRSTETSYGVGLGDAADSPWADVELLGRKLSREEALAHPWKADVFALTDEAFARDPTLAGFVRRMHCGQPGEPLEHGYGMPQDLFDLGEARDARAKRSESFASIDGARFFVRCLVPIPVEHYGPWSIGVWVEVAKADHDRAHEIWDDLPRFAALRFRGTIANDVENELDVPIRRGAVVDVHVPDPKRPPVIRTSDDLDLRKLLTREWPQAEFETYAVARGYL